VNGVRVVLLAGGRASRLGGVDKPALPVGPGTLLDGVLDRALAVTGDPGRIVVVGPRRPVATAVRWTREDPPGSGPLAALAAGLAALPEPDPDEPVAVLAADLAGLRPDTLPRLRDALTAEPGRAGVLLRDADGHPQWLCGVWRSAALRAALPERPDGGSLRGVLGPLRPRELPARPGETADVDTPEDLARARDDAGRRAR
jgi:molybdenum cofactor guanylyltransferase